MFKNLIMLAMAILVVSLLVFIIIGFMAGISNPMPWILTTILVLVLFFHDKFMKKKYLVWKDSYSVGIEALDNDHKKLIHLINNLQTAIDYKTDREFEKQTLNEVIDYTKYHFTREEELMVKYGYPDYLPHKAKHQEMIGKVNEFVKNYENDVAGTIESLLAYLKGWLIKHINGTDKEYSSFFIDKGVK